MIDLNMSAPRMDLKLDRIDSHQHFWQPHFGFYDWLTPALGNIYRDFVPEDLSGVLKAAGISKTILVQAAETTRETEFMLALAAQYDFIGGVVGWVDMESHDAPQLLSAWARNPDFKGIRPMMQDMADDEWMLQPHLGPVFQTLIDLNLSFDALIKPRHLPILFELLQRYPDLNVVIDHAAKPEIAAGNFDTWARSMERIAQAPQVYCKLSGLITETDINASQIDNPFAQLSPYVAHLLTQFGASGLMWGSDWPVINLASDYLAWVAACTEFLAPLSCEQQEQIWSGTAKQFYRLAA